ncbi:MAG: DUF1080 domain-containing protein [Thermoguttaceae bacterium]|nr:DUF1080 domain-containing protein [Thermoguttaceae bacterium]
MKFLPQNTVCGKTVRLFPFFSDIQRFSQDVIRRAVAVSLFFIAVSVGFLPLPLCSVAETQDSPTVLERILRLHYLPTDNNSVVKDFCSYGNNWSIQEQADGNVVIGAQETGSRLAWETPAGQEMVSGDIEVELFIPEKKQGFSGILFKNSKNGIGADAFNGYEVGFNPFSQIVNIGAHRQNYTPIKQVPASIPVGEWFKVGVHFEEESFEVFLEGQSIFQYTEADMRQDDPLRRGTVALRNWEDETNYRNLKVRIGGDQDWQNIPFEHPEFVQDTPETLDTEELPPILVLLRSQLTRPYSVGNDIWQARPQYVGCEIRLINPANPSEPVKTIFADPTGSIYDMNLSFDAQTIFFSYCPAVIPAGASADSVPKSNNSDGIHWHIWKINVDGTGLTQLTDGDFYDVGAIELPDGDLAFVSTRRFGHTVCQPGPASNLFRMKPDGSDIRCISMNSLSDFNPQILPDGRLLFTRWEYVDRDLTYRQSLWTENPEGTQYQLFFGNTNREVGSFLQARPVPDCGSSKVVATLAPHHGYPQGGIGIIDRQFGVEGNSGSSFNYLTKDVTVINDTSRDWSYRDPFPLDEERVLCSFGSEGPTVFSAEELQTQGPRYRIWLLDSDGAKKMLYEDVKYGCYYPIPLQETERPPVLSSRINPKKTTAVLRPSLQKEQIAPPVSDSWGIPEKTDLLAGDPVGTVILVDVYNGISPVVEPGKVKSIRIMEQIRKTEDLVNRAYDQSPVIGYGTYYAKRCWGTVPVEEDGSAHFYVPALREVYFQILDDQGRELQRMTSAVQLMPGESLSCLGCHEPRETTSASGAQLDLSRPIAATRSPDIPRLPEWMTHLTEERARKVPLSPDSTEMAEQGNTRLDTGIFDYPTVVQPVLDRYCVSCHQGENPDGGYDLSGDKTRFFSESYDNLLGKSRSYRQHNMLTGEMLPEQAALGKPLVHFYWLLFTPSAVSEPGWAGTLASRLPDYFTEEHCGQAIPQEDLERVWFWMDANVPYYGTFAHAKPNAAGRRDRWAQAETAEMAPWMQNGILPVYEEKCASCHKNLLGGNRDLPGVHDAQNIDWTGRFAWINLTRPENSPLLTAHLSKDAGGRGLATQSEQPESILFKDKSDATYQSLLKSIQEGSQMMYAIPEADMPGFKNARPEP